MKVVAITINGYRNLAEKNVTSISAGGNRYNIIGKKAIDKLVGEAIISGQMQIYSSDVNVNCEKLDGKIDGMDGTPSFTNGQISVERLLVDDIVVWER